MAHVLLFPFPAQGHLPAMLTLAELFSGAGLSVTFVNTDNIHRRLLVSSNSTLDRLARLPQFRFRTIPDGLPEDDPRSMFNFVDLQESLRTRSREHYRELLVEKDGWPPVTCVVADGYFALAVEVAEEMGIPVLLLPTNSAGSILALCSIPKLIENGEIPFPEDADMDEPVRGVPGMECFLRRRDLPSTLKNARTIDDKIIRFLAMSSKRLASGSALIMNTAESLNMPELTHIRAFCPATYTVGPLKSLLQNIGSTAPSHPSLWQEDRTCLTWLDSQPNNSVVYVSFGSIAVVSRETIAEFWHGLVNSGQRFLWVIRDDMVEGCESLTKELDTATRERGCLVKWAPQEEVLAHRAVGCFLTHSGWNSTLESIVAGVPMICWPFFADQPINSRFVSEVWKVGVDMKDLSGRSAVEGMVRKVMEGGAADAYRKSASELSVAVRSAAAEGGSSYLNFQSLVQHIKSLSSQDDLKS